MSVSPEGGGDEARRGRWIDLDANGVARLDGLIVGRYRATLREHGLLPTTAVFEVTAGGTAQVLLEEPEGGTVDLLVVDEDERPLPFSAFTIRQPSRLDWLDLDTQDVQRVDPFTDARGRRSLGHVEPGAVEISIAWGSRTAKATVAVVEGRPTLARFVLPSSGVP